MRLPVAPARAAPVNAWLQRLGVDPAGRSYYSLHASVDRGHADSWKREVLRPLAAQNPEVAPLLAEGALLRLRANARCFDRHHRMLLV